MFKILKERNSKYLQKDLNWGLLHTMQLPNLVPYYSQEEKNISSTF